MGELEANGLGVVRRRSRAVPRHGGARAPQLLAPKDWADAIAQQLSVLAASPYAGQDAATRARREFRRARREESRGLVRTTRRARTRAGMVARSARAGRAMWVSALMDALAHLTRSPRLTP